MTPEMEKLVFNLRNKTPIGEPITNAHLAQAADLIEELDKALTEAIADRDWFYKLLVESAEKNDEESEEWESDAEENH